MNIKGSGIIAYLFWMALGFFLGLFIGRGLWKC